MADYAEKHKKPLKAYLADEEHAAELEVFALTAQEWCCVKDLHNVLKPLKQATLFFSRGDNPNLATVIPEMDRLDHALATFSIDDTLEPSIHAAVHIAKATLNRYYSKTDESDAYRIAMVLHPRHKLAYFRKHGWEEEWIATAETITRTVYDKKYAIREVQNEDAPEQDLACKDGESSVHR
ncbi:hypothetical protein EV714DRAFT_222494 [Schizophyllum commune]